MNHHSLYITDFDMQQLNFLIKLAKWNDEYTYDDYKNLKVKLNRAQIIRSKDIPKDVVTMNSKVQLLDNNSLNETVVRVVYPKDENLKFGRVSVSTPLGIALLGSREGDTIEWAISRGSRPCRAKVLRIIYQPEARGHLAL